MSFGEPWLIKASRSLCSLALHCTISWSPVAPACVSFLHCLGQKPFRISCFFVFLHMSFGVPWLSEQVCILLGVTLLNKLKSVHRRPACASLLLCLRQKPPRTLRLFVLFHVSFFLLVPCHFSVFSPCVARFSTSRRFKTFFFSPSSPLHLSSTFFFSTSSVCFLHSFSSFLCHTQLFLYFLFFLTSPVSLHLRFSSYFLPSLSVCSFSPVSCCVLFSWLTFTISAFLLFPSFFLHPCHQFLFFLSSFLRYQRSILLYVTLPLLLFGMGLPFNCISFPPSVFLHSSTHWFSIPFFFPSFIHAFVFFLPSFYYSGITSFSFSHQHQHSYLSYSHHVAAFFFTHHYSRTLSPPLRISCTFPTHALYLSSLFPFPSLHSFLSHRPESVLPY